MTRDELLKQAQKCMNEVTNYPTDDETTHVIANGLAAIACILLAKELREGAETVGLGDTLFHVMAMKHSKPVTIHTEHDLEREVESMIGEG
jgi:hypothetical protein